MDIVYFSIFQSFWMFMDNYKPTSLLGPVEDWTSVARTPRVFLLLFVHITHVTKLFSLFLTRDVCVMGVLFFSLKLNVHFISVLFLLIKLDFSVTSIIFLYFKRDVRITKLLSCLLGAKTRHTHLLLFTRTLIQSSWVW